MNRISTRALEAFATVFVCAALSGCLSSEVQTSKAPPEAIPEPAVAAAPAPAAPATRPSAAVAAAPMACDNSRLYYPTGDQATSMILLERKAQAQPRVGKPYKYQLIVTNLTNTPLRGVTIQEMLPGSFAVSADAGGTQSAAPTTGPAMASAGSDMAMPADKSGSMSQHTHSIGELGPKESRAINLSGTPSQPGPMNTCTTVTCSPTLCTACTVVNPQLRLSKQAIGSGDLCEVQTIRYTVTNTGTGDLAGVRIDDQLAEGLTMENGSAGRVALNVGTLAQGQSRSADVKVKANAAGSFASIASATAADDVTAKSDSLAMAIKAPQLEVTLKAPEKEYLGEDVKYEVTVKNVGDAIARNPVVRIDDTGATAGAGNSNDAQLAAAHIGGQPSADRPRDAGQKVGQLAPGASKTITVAYKPRAEGDLHVNAVASDPCANIAKAPGVTRMTSLPALLLSAVDDHDPIRVGENVTYTISVQNQGFGADKDIKVLVTLPDAEQYVSSTGPSEGKLDGNKLTFEPVATIAAKQTLTWKLVVKASKAADVRLRVDMNSASFPDAAVKMEPTRLY